MIVYDNILNIPPYSLNKDDKFRFLTELLSQLTKHHFENCLPYRNILEAAQYDLDTIDSYYDIPFLPVRLFKNHDLKSVPDDQVIKTMTSSGTTGQAVSRIYLDRDTSARQTKVLTKIVASFLGPKRVPLIILDSPAVLKDRNLFSARGAGILGFSMFAYDKIYAFNEDMSLNNEGITEFVTKHKDEKIMLFGFTFMIWKHFYKALKDTTTNISIENGIMIHGGGWKKLLDEAVSPSDFKQAIKDVSGISEIHDYYGMVEQTGTIYMECEYGHLHPSIFSDVIIRRPFDFTIANHGEKGIIQVVSILPTSYPGHSLLTEDEGYIIGEDTCPCGRLGKFFAISGRVKQAEIRGCSDTYAI